MFPAWLPKRRHSQKLKNKLSDSHQLQLPYLDDSSHDQRIEDTALPTTRFAQALALHEVISRARKSHLEAELAGYLAGRKDGNSMGPSQASQKGMQSRPANEQIHAEAYFDAAECTRHSVMSSYSTLQDHNPLSILSKDSGSRPSKGESARISYDGADYNKKFFALKSKNYAREFSRECRRYFFCLQNGSNDIDTENSTILTPDSIESSFDSESTSEGSSEGHKSSGLMEARMHRVWQWPTPLMPLGLEEMYCRETDSSSSQRCYCNDAIGLPSWQDDQNKVSITECCSNRLNSGGIQRIAGQSVASSEANDISSRLSESASLCPTDVRHKHDGSVEGGLNPLSSAQVKSNLERSKSTKREKTEKLDYSRSTSGEMPLQCETVGNGTSCGRVLYSKREETNAVIGVENPQLMLSSRFEEQKVQSPSAFGASFHNDNLSDFLRHAAREDGNVESSECEGRHSMDILETTEDPLTVLAKCNDDEGYPKLKVDGYSKKGRRQRGSSFSAALPEELQSVVGDGVAFVKMSHNPYDDFRQSMYEMIMEQDLEESPIEVEDLLHCYLSLNSPELHPLITEVFSDVWSSILMNMR